MLQMCATCVYVLYARVYDLYCYPPFIPSGGCVLLKFHTLHMQMQMCVCVHTYVCTCVCTVPTKSAEFA